MQLRIIKGDRPDQEPRPAGERTAQDAYDADELASLQAAFEGGCKGHRRLTIITGGLER